MNTSIAKKTTLTLVLLLSLLITLVPIVNAQEEWPANQPPDPWKDVEGPRYGGVLRIGSIQEPIHLNPAIVASGIVVLISNKIYEPLVRYGIDDVWEPELAYAWESSDDLLTWTFHIYENATWHDGKPITTEDVLYSYDVFTERHPTGVIFNSVVESVEAPDDYTFVMQFTHVDVSWRSMFPLFSIIPKHVFDISSVDILDNDATHHPYVGSGAYKFVEWKTGEYVKLTRNENYYQKDLPYLNEVYFIFAPDSMTNAALFENGDVDFIAYGCPLQEIARWRENPIAGQYSGLYAGIKGMVNSFMLMNDPDYAKYTSQQKFRQAMAYSWDYDRIIRDETFGIGIRAYTLFPMFGSNAWSYNPNAKHYDYNPDKANELLDDLGYNWDADNKWRIDPDTGEPVALRGTTGTTTSAETEIIVENLEDVGIKVNLKQYTGQASISVIFNDYNYDLYTWGGCFTGPDVSHIEEYLGTAYMMKGSMWANGGRYSNLEVDELFKKAKMTSDLEERKGYYWEIQEIWGEEVPWIPTYATGRESPHNQAFKGKFWPMNVSMHQDPIKNIWWVYGELKETTTPQVTEDIEIRLVVLEDTILDLSTKISDLETQLSTTPSTMPTNIAYVAILIAAIAISVSLYFGLKKSN